MAARRSIKSAIALSLLDLGHPLHARLSLTSFSFGGSQVSAAIADHVLYVPEPRLQLLGNEFFPVETGFDQLDLQVVCELHDGLPTMHFDPEDADFVSGLFCVLANPWSMNFSHWMEELTKVVVLEDNNFEGNYVLPKHDDLARTSLGLLGVDTQRLTPWPRRPTVFEQAVFLERYNFVDAFARPDRFLAVRQRLYDASPTTSSRGEKIWITRSGTRQIVNWDDVSQLLDEYEVDVIDFAKFELAEQIAIARNARMLAGPHGSGFMHALFTPKRSTIIECFSPEWLNPTWTSIYRMMDHRYFQIVPPSTQYNLYPHGDDMLIDPDHLALSLSHAVRGAHQ